MQDEDDTRAVMLVQFFVRVLRFGVTLLFLSETWIP